MRSSRPMATFIGGFIVVMMAGAAMAQVGPFSGSAAAPGLIADDAAAEAPAPADTAPPPTAPPPTAAQPGWEADGGIDELLEDEPPGEEPPADEPPAEEPPGDDPPADEEPPADLPHDDETWIEILYPAPEQIFGERTVVFEGETEPGAKVTAGHYEATVNDHGGWRIVLVLTHEGANRATFTATDPAGNTATDSIVVFYEPPAHDWEWSAHQQWEASDDPEPYNVYFGTGKPGAAVHVVSEFGSGVTEVNDHGEWEIAIHFREYPLNDEFKVVVESLDNRAEFWFIIFGHQPDWTWSAHQQYGSCGEEIPYDIFYGTGKPGELVWVESPYGSGTTEVNGDGHWEIRVEFPEAPFGEPFEAVVEHLDFRQVFGFVRTST